MSNSPYFDAFGNLKSIISKDRRCWFCGSANGLEIHHAFSGCFDVDWVAKAKEAKLVSHK